MTTQDIRWIQRLNNYTKALSQLTKFIEQGQLNELHAKFTALKQEQEWIRASA